MGKVQNLVKLWDTRTGQLKLTLQGRIYTMTSLTFSPDGKILAGGSGLAHTDSNKSYGEVLLWNAQTGQLLHTLRGHTDMVTSLAFSPDSKILVSGSRDSTVKVWDVQTGKLKRKLIGRWNEDEMNQLVFSPDGKTLAGASSFFSDAEGAEHGEVVLWNTSTWRMRRALPQYHYTMTGIAFSPNSKTIALGVVQLADFGTENGVIRLYRTQTGKIRRTLRVPRGEVNLQNVAFTLNGKQLVSISGGGYYKKHLRSGKLRLWSVSTGKIRKVLRSKPDKGVIAVVFSPNRRGTATGGLDGTVKLWRVS